MRNRLRNFFCLVLAAMSAAGCTELVRLAGTTALGFMHAPPHQTFRLAEERMAIPAEQLSGLAFAEGLHRNIYLDDIAGAEILQRLHGGELDSNDTGNVRAALSKSMDNAGLLSNDPQTARYRLATVVTGNDTAGTMEIKVTTHMQFVLTDALTKVTLLKESVASTGDVPFSSDNLLYRSRMGGAMEAAVRENFRVLLNRLSQLAVSPAEIRPLAEPEPLTPVPISGP